MLAAVVVAADVEVIVAFRFRVLLICNWLVALRPVMVVTVELMLPPL